MEDYIVLNELCNKHLKIIAVNLPYNDNWMIAGQEHLIKDLLLERDEFAINFAKFINKNGYEKAGNMWYDANGSGNFVQTKQILEKFKQTYNSQWTVKEEDSNDNIKQDCIIHSFSHGHLVCMICGYDARTNKI